MKKRILSLLLAGGMILTSLTLPGPTASTAEAAAGDSLVAHYGFDGDFKDSVNGSEGTTVNSNAPTLVTDDERGQVMKSGSGTGRIQTDNPLYGKDLSSDGFYGLSTNGSVFFNDNPGAATYQDMTQFAGNITKDGGWEYITVVMDTEQIHMYKDGALVYELTPSTLGVHAGEGTPYMLDFIEGAQYLWFGTASPHYWNSGDFYMDDLKVYSTALSAEDVLAEYLSDETEAKAIVAADKEALNVDPTVQQSLSLPSAGASEYTQITWESSNESVIAADGTVTRPEEDTVVTLTATITLGAVADTKIFEVTVPKADPQGDLQMYADQLTLNAGYVGSDLELPISSGPAAVTWSSSNSDAITPAGAVTRGKENVDVTLTATLKMDGATDVTKEFKLVVLAEGGNVASYVSNDKALSTDGLKGQKGGMKLAAEGEEGYEALHKDQPVMYTTVGAKSYVSPQVFRKADGSFAMITVLIVAAFSLNFGPMYKEERRARET